MKTLGARDPTINELLSNKFYKNYINCEKGNALFKALLKNEISQTEIKANGYQLFQRALNAGLENIANILQDAETRIKIQ